MYNVHACNNVSLSISRFDNISIHHIITRYQPTPTFDLYLKITKTDKKFSEIIFNFIIKSFLMLSPPSIKTRRGMYLCCKNIPLR